MATTTNYSWSTPDDTALVKDGAAAIRSLGTAIDTTVFTNAGAAINKTIVDAKGDLIVASGADAVARLAVGTNDHVLTADSGATNGVKWAALPAAGGMTLISTTTLSGATTTLSSIPGTYKNLQVIIQNYKPATDGDFLILRFNGDTGSNRHTAFADSSGNKAFDGNRQFISNPQDNSVAQGLTVLNISNYANTTTWKFWEMCSIGNDSTTTTNLSYARYPAAYNQISAITSLEFANNSGGNFTSGTILLYGVS
jgi:hypothetical protein